MLQGPGFPFLQALLVAHLISHARLLSGFVELVRNCIGTKRMHVQDKGDARCGTGFCELPIPDPYQDLVHSAQVYRLPVAPWKRTCLKVTEDASVCFGPCLLRQCPGPEIIFFSRDDGPREPNRGAFQI